MKLGINGRFLAARPTGVQRFALEVCQALAERCELTLLLPADATLPKLQGQVDVIRGVLRGHGWEQLELPRMVERASIELLLNPANTAPWSVPHQAIVVHDVLPLTHPQWFSRRYRLLHRYTFRRIIAQAAHIITFTESTAREIVQACHVPGDRIRLITQGLAPFTEPAPPAQVVSTLKRYGITHPYCLFVGRGDPRKNLELMARVFPELWRTHELTLVAVGKSAPHIHIAHSVAEMTWLRALKYVDDATLRALYTGALALCFPSRAEGFGRPPLEALACGTPALAGDYPAAHEVLGDAVPILAHEPATWIGHLRTLVEQPGERARLAHRGAEILQRFDWGRAADQLLAALATRPIARATA